MTENNSFLQSIAVDTATLNRINKLPSLLAKRSHYIIEFFTRLFGAFEKRV